MKTNKTVRQSNLLAIARILSVLAVLITIGAVIHNWTKPVDERYLITYFSCEVDKNKVCKEVTEGDTRSVYLGTTGAYLQGITMRAIKMGGYTCTNRDDVCIIADQLAKDLLKK